MNISVICPVYNGENYLNNLHLSLLMQEKVNIKSIKYVLTESNDKSEDILKAIDADYKEIKKEDFSHSLTREKYAIESEGDIIVFITQDVIIRDKYWLYNLTKNIVDGTCQASFSRQICECEGIERYIRPKNYPNKCRVVSKDDIQEYGLMTFFLSDVASAIRKDVFIKLNGYDEKDLIISEDMYIAYKLIMNGYKIKYCSDSIVIHSHQFTFRQLFNRYFDTGVFFANNEYLNEYNANKSGFSLATYVIKNSLKERDYKTFFNIIPNFTSRFIGMKLGKIYKKLPKDLSLHFSLNKMYWVRNFNKCFGGK